MKNTNTYFLVFPWVNFLEVCILYNIDAYFAILFFGQILFRDYLVGSKMCSYERKKISGVLLIFTANAKSVNLKFNQIVDF